MRSCLYFVCFICMSTGLSGQARSGTPQPVTVLGTPHVNHHGDPPFLLEEGWIPLINGKDMGGWKYRDENKAGSWTAAKGIYWDRATDSNVLIAISNTGDRIVNLPLEGGASDIISMQTIGDMELYVEYMVPDSSDAGVYIHGLYELQIKNSFGLDFRSPVEKTSTIIGYADRSDPIAPTVRAERPQGHWNAFHIWYQAPKFDASGKKIENAKFLRILLNGQLIHENQERKAAAHASLEIPEAAINPAVMLQGSYGPVAFRNIYVKPLQ